MGLAILLGVVLALAWKIAQVSERRAVQATREHLASSLGSLVSERLAKQQVLEAAWKSRNPFTLLRWQQDNYCGELAAGEQPERGCWYWLPQRAWVLYRSRFGDEWTRTRGGLQVYRLLAVPGVQLATPQSKGATFALELQEVPLTELSAAGLLDH
ncbi:hypothetical protein A9179_19830 [Pseudomonas alcaligenes]|uniref:Uncharacterized protein n=1 Tax=Aquipseudomonas alcaligenes TaxID=43263 RepID=A0ABR7S4M3_AQUAC|nr:hypothetical protein [Pseudomonas alcaligenes]